MKQELTGDQMLILVDQIRQIQRQHPKAKVVYDCEKEVISITYPLPKDFWEIRKISFVEKEL